MKLVIDIGNTNIKFGLFENNKLKKLKTINVKDYKTIPNFKFEDAVIGSVVPSMTTKIYKEILSKRNIKSKIVKADDFKNEFNLSKFNVNEIGTDILALALAIKKHYNNGIGISFGTATFAIIVKNNDIFGVIIAPSFDNALEDLSHKTALIKNIKTKDIGLNFGYDTPSSLHSGMMHTINGFINSISDFAKEKYHISNIYITGGKSKWIMSNKKIPHFDNAVLIGYDLISC